MKKYANIAILLLMLLAAFSLKDSFHLSTNLLSLFVSKDSVQKLHIADELGYSKELLIGIKGFDSDAKKRLKTISKSLESIKGITSVQYRITPSEMITAYYATYAPLLSTFNSTRQSREAIRSQLQQSFNDLSSSPFYTPISSSDPLQLFTMPRLGASHLSYRGDFITLGGYGYLIRAKTDVSPSQLKKAKKLYHRIKEALEPYKDVVAFAPFFYTVENSQKIQSDITKIIIISTLTLLIIYYILIRNIALLTQTLIALTSSMLFATLVSALVFKNFHILSLAFGISISSVSIDYLLHYYFHNFYQDPKRIDRNVLYGFLTTTVAFTIFTFIPIPLIAQISFFAILSLSFAYVLFTFLFPYLPIKKYHSTQEEPKSTPKISALFFIVLSAVLLIYSFTNLHLDKNIRNLDYQNSSLKAVEALFRSQNSQQLKPVLVQAKTQDKLISALHAIQEKIPETFSLARFVPDKKRCLKKISVLKAYDFERLNRIINEEAASVGFRAGYFKDAYRFTRTRPSCTMHQLDIFENYGLSIYKYKNTYYTIALVPDLKDAASFDAVSPIDAKAILSKIADTMYDHLIHFSLLVIATIMLLLFFSVKRRFFYALSYILFPVAVVLAYLVTFSTPNMMHFFALIILIAIGIDYGIYMSNTKKAPATMLAIRYSLLSTFAAFGVLIFSSITALYSIGIVISIGVLTIFLLLKVMQ